MAAATFVWCDAVCVNYGKNQIGTEEFFIWLH